MTSNHSELTIPLNFSTFESDCDGVSVKRLFILFILLQALWIN
ncbi:MAG: hypothetical protein ACI82Q_001666, partial [Nonlabens sp.]